MLLTTVEKKLYINLSYIYTEITENKKIKSILKVIKTSW